MFLSAASVPGLALAQIDTGGGAPADAPVNLNRVTVSGDRSTVKQAPERVDVNATETKDIITKTKIEQLGTTTDFLFTLSDLPNTVVWDGGGNTISGAKIVMNGFDQTRINFQLDGIPINDPGSYSFYSYQYAQNDIIKSIVVTPGAGNAATVGLSAIGGNVAINTDDADADFYLQPRLGAGSYNKYEQAGKISSGTLLQGIAPTSMYLAGTHTSSQSFFDNNSGSRDNLAFKSNTSLLGGKLTTFFDYNNQAYSYNEGCTASNIAASGQSCNFYNNTPNNENNTVYNYNSFRNWIAYADYSMALGNAKIDEKFYAYWGNGYGGEGYYGYANAAANSKSTLFEPSLEKTHQWGDILKADIPLPFAGITLQPGLWFQLDRSQHRQNVEDIVAFQQTENPLYDEDVRTLTTTPYFNVNLKPVEHLTVDVGAKYMILDRSYNAPPITEVAGQPASQSPGEFYTASFRSLLPSIGANYEFLSGWHAYANYSRNARPPGYSEFYEVSGNFSLESGLKPEKTDNYNLGVYFEKGPFEGRISAFDTHYQDYILNLSVSRPDGSGYITQVENVGSAHYSGGALAMTYLITPWLQAFANVGIIKTWIDRFNDGPASYAPNQTQSGGLFANYHGLSSTVSVDHVGQRGYLYIDGDDGVNTFNYLSLHSLTTVNASVGYDWKTSSSVLKELDTHLALRNLTNTRVPVDYNIGFANDYNPNDPLKVLNTPFAVFLTIDAKLF